MFPQVKPAHRGAEQSSRAHWRAPVIPTSFPAATAAAPGPGTRHGAAGSRPPGPQQPSAAFSLAPVKTPRHARVAGCRRSRLICRGSGGRQQPGHPAQRSGIDCCAGVASLRMSARRHVLEAQPGPTAAKLLPRRRTTTVTWRQAWNIGPDDGRPWTILDGLAMPTDLMVRRPSWRLPPCPPRARKEGHLRRFTVSHGATGSALDLCSRRSSGCGHYLCKQGVRGSSLSSSTRQNVSGKDHPLPV